MADSGDHKMEVEADVERKITHDMRYYYLHRDEKNAKRLERYHNDPAVIAKREEKERKRAEKEAQKEAEKLAQKEAKRIEKETNLQKIVDKCIKTKRKTKTKSDGGLTDFLTESSPVRGKDDK